MERPQRIGLFSKSTKLENMGPGTLVFRVMQGQRQIFTNAVRPGRHMYCFGSDIYRNDSEENPITVYVRLEEYGVEPAQQWTPLHYSMFGNARIRIAGNDSVENPLAIHPFKGNKIGRLRFVVDVKLGIKKVMEKIGFGN